MKKLILVPTILTTAFLLFVFLLPTTAAGVVQTVVAPAFHAVAPPAETAAGGSSTITTSNGSGFVSTTRQGSPQGAGQSLSSTNLLADSLSVHILATVGQQDCGRFGNGHHGGKHDFVCPNQPFPRPPNQ